MDMEYNRKILVVDDDADLRLILSRFLSRSGRASEGELAVSESIRKLRGQSDGLEKQNILSLPYEVDTAGQGEEGLEKIKTALEAGRPYSVMFVDMRMQPGWDGLETMMKVWEADPRIQVILLTAYSDYSWKEIVSRIGKRDNFVIFKKPFDVVEVSQVALAFTQKYNLERETEMQMKQITEAEKILRQTKNHLDSIIQSMPSMLLSVKSDGAVTQWNRRCESFSGVSHDDAVSRKFWELLPFLDGMKDAFGTAGSSLDSHSRNRIEIGDKDTSFLDVSIFPLELDGSADGAVIRIDDVTVSEKKDAQLRQMQKMETVGKLAVGIAHDFKNIIGAVKSTADSMDYSLSSPSDISKLVPILKSDLEIIRESVERGTDMIRQLLSLSSVRELPLSLADINTLVANVLKMCSNVFPESIEINVVYHEGKALAEVYPMQIEQAILNLCINASHAMTTMRESEGSGGGILDISVSRVSLDPKKASYIPEAHPGFYWAIGVADSGVGMEKEILKKIFDPFFTAKKEGNGLGLSMVYSIVKQHGGFVEVDSEPGGGSKFTLFIPEPLTPGTDGACERNIKSADGGS